MELMDTSTLYPSHVRDTPDETLGVSIGREPHETRQPLARSHYRRSCDTDSSESDSPVQTPTIWQVGFAEKEARVPSSGSAFMSSVSEVTLLKEQLGKARTEAAMHERREIDLQAQLIQLQAAQKKQALALQRMGDHLDRFETDRQAISTATPISEENRFNDHLAYTKTLVDRLVAMMANNPETDLENGEDSMLGTDLGTLDEEDPCHRSLAQDAIGRQLLRHLETLAHTHQKKHARLVHALHQFRERQYMMKKKLKQSDRHTKHLQRELTRVTRQSDNYVTVMRARVLRAERMEKEASERQGSVQPWKEKLVVAEKALEECRDEKNAMERTLDAVQSDLQTARGELEETKLQAGRHKAQASRLRASLDAVQQKAGHKEGLEALRALRMEAERHAMDLERESKRQALAISELFQERHALQAACRQSKDALARAQKEQRHAEHRLEVLQAQKLGQPQRVGQEEALEKKMAGLKAELESRMVAINDLNAKTRVANAEQHEIQSALQKTLGERDAQIAKLRREQEKQGTEREAWKIQARRTIEAELQCWRDNVRLEATRQARALEVTIAELEVEIDNLERCREEDAKRIERIEQDQAEARRHQREHLHTLQVVDELRERISGLEEEVLLLYTKNLAFAKRLGDMIP